MSKLTPSETKYMAYLQTPRTTKDMMSKFEASNVSVYQVLNSLRVKKCIFVSGRDGYWKIWSVLRDQDVAAKHKLTDTQRLYLEHIYTDGMHCIKSIADHFGKSYYTSTRIVRIMNLLGYITDVGYFHKHTLWMITDEGKDALDNDNEQNI